MTAVKKVATPVDWKVSLCFTTTISRLMQPGSACMVVPSVPQDEASKLFPAGVSTIEVPSKKPYLRITQQP